MLKFESDYKTSYGWITLERPRKENYINDKHESIFLFGGFILSSGDFSYFDDKFKTVSIIKDNLNKSSVIHNVKKFNQHISPKREQDCSLVWFESKEDMMLFWNTHEKIDVLDSIKQGNFFVKIFDIKSPFGVRNIILRKIYD